MLIKLNNEPKILKTNPFRITYNTEIESKIKKNWDKFIIGKNNFWNGDIFSVANYDVDKNILEISMAQFSDLIYARENEEINIRSLFVAILLKTKDNFYVVIRNNHNKINIIGGIADKADFVNDNFKPENCLKREIKEELNLDLNDSNQIITYEMKYLKLPNNNENYYPCGIIYTGLLNFNKQDLFEYFATNKEKFDNEIQEIYCYSYNECINLTLNPKEEITYLKELVELENTE